MTYWSEFLQRKKQIFFPIAAALFGLILQSGKVVGQSPSVPPGAPVRTQIYDWKQTAALEHEDRKRRFQRLSAQGVFASPTFYEALIGKEDLKKFGISLPVLRIVFPQKVFFNTDKSELREEANQILDWVAQNLRGDVPDLALFVAGHTDSRGTDEYNYVLSVERADTVARALFSRGIGTAKLWRVGFGEAVPLKPNDSAGNMAENRRVEFLFAAKPEAVAALLSKQTKIICAGSESSILEECREKISMMPPIVAKPVLSDRRDSITPLGQRNSVESGENRATTKLPDNRGVVEIEKNSLVVIDLKEQRVTVGSPVL